ncbi:MAG: hypothetical protein ACRCXZ_06050 [Patescibacteria group bacterium]
MCIACNAPKATVTNEAEAEPVITEKYALIIGGCNPTMSILVNDRAGLSQAFVVSRELRTGQEIGATGNMVRLTADTTLVKQYLDAKSLKEAQAIVFQSFVEKGLINSCVPGASNKAVPEIKTK